VPLEALDLGLYNWDRARRATVGADGEVDATALAAARAALSL
jgi:hypothetical protein